MSTPSTSVASAPAGNPTRKKALTVLSIVVLLGLAYGGFEYYGARHSEETDNAYVQGNVIQITPQVGGTVTAIMADDTDFVKAGQALVKLDPADAKVALVDAMSDCGYAKIEVTSFTSPKAIPMLRDAEEVMGRIRRMPGAEYTVLVPNVRGAARAPESR
eukprot:gene20744-40626_t